MPVPRSCASEHIHGSLQDNSSDKVLAGIILRHTSIDEDRRPAVFEGVDIDTMEIVDSIERARVPGIPIVGDVGLGEEVGGVGIGIDDRSADNANGAWNIGATNVGLQERRVHLAGVDERTGLCVERADPVLR